VLISHHYLFFFFFGLLPWQIFKFGFNLFVKAELWSSIAFTILPKSLVDIADDAVISNEYRELWPTTTRGILAESEADCLAHSSRTCAYGSPAVNTAQLPLPFFHKLGGSVLVLVDPPRRHERCRTRVRQQALQIASGFRWSSNGQRLGTDPFAFGSEEPGKAVFRGPPQRQRLFTVVAQRRGRAL